MTNTQTNTSSRHTFLGIVAEVLSIDSGLLGQHFEVVANLLLATPPVNLLLEAGEGGGDFDWCQLDEE